MKTYARNLLFASLLYVIAFIAIVLISMLSDIGISLFMDEETVNPDTIIFIASVFFAFLASYAAYLAFYLIQRSKARNDPNARYLGVLPRVVGAIIAIVLSFAVVFLCLNWTSDYGEIISILYANYTLIGVIMGVAAAVDFVSFILFKPRV
jgi:uncharacterized membrane protein